MRTTLASRSPERFQHNGDDTDRDFLPNGEPRRQHGLHRTITSGATDLAGEWIGGKLNPYLYYRHINQRTLRTRRTPHLNGTAHCVTDTTT